MNKFEFEFPEGKVPTLYELERRYIVAMLELHHGNKTMASASLGITIKTLYNKLHEYGLFDEYSKQNYTARKVSIPFHTVIVPGPGDTVLPIGNLNHID